MDFGKFLTVERACSVNFKHWCHSFQILIVEYVILIIKLLFVIDQIESILQLIINSVEVFFLIYL